MAIEHPTLLDLANRVLEQLGADNHSGFFEIVNPGIADWLNEGFRLQHEFVLQQLRGRDGGLQSQMEHPYVQRFVRRIPLRVNSNSHEVVLDSDEAITPVTPTLGTPEAGGQLADVSSYDVRIAYYDPVAHEWSNWSEKSAAAVTTAASQKIPITFNVDENWQARFTEIWWARDWGTPALKPHRYEGRKVGVTNLDDVAIATEYVGLVADTALGQPPARTNPHMTALDQRGEIPSGPASLPPEIRDRELLSIVGRHGPTRAMRVRVVTPAYMQQIWSGNPLFALAPDEVAILRDDAWTGLGTLRAFTGSAETNLTPFRPIRLDAWVLRTPDDLGLFSIDFAAQDQRAPVDQRYCEGPLQWALRGAMERMMQASDVYEARFKEALGMIP